VKVLRKKRRSRFDANWNRIVLFRQPEQLIKRIDFHSPFGFNVEKIDWLNYWQEAIEIVDARKFFELLELLRLARTSYLTHPRNESHTKNYCQIYFEFLHYAVHSEDLEPFRRKVLHRLVGLETIPVYWQESSRPDLIVVNTKTNPVYLLSRIHQPKSWDNLRFLPMVTYGSFDDANDQGVPIYHHYRRISRGTTEPTTLFTYIPVSIADRKNSFVAWQQLATLLTPKKDTLIKTRSRCLAKQVLRPVIAKIPGVEQSPEKTLRVADLGGGSGDLTNAIFENLLTAHLEPTDSFQISLNIVDYDFPDMKRHLKKTAFFRSLVALMCERKDFLNWVFEESISSDTPKIQIKTNMSKQQASKPFDLILMFRLFNNMSEFGIDKATTWEEVLPITNEKLTEQDWQEGKYYPHLAISVNQLQKIVLSTKQITVNSQTTWCIASLTDYFQALYYLSRQEAGKKWSNNTIFFPTRKLNLDQIRYRSGRNLFEDLCRLGHYVVIEDIDLRMQDLRRYFDQHGLSRLKVIDLPCKIPLSNTFCVFEENTSTLLPG